jgi:hypothetical protein
VWWALYPLLITAARYFDRTVRTNYQAVLLVSCIAVAITQARTSAARVTQAL